MNEETTPIDLPSEQLPEEWQEPDYVRWATDLAARPTYDALTPPTEEEEGSIYESLYREKVLGQVPHTRKRKRTAPVVPA